MFIILQSMQDVVLSEEDHKRLDAIEAPDQMPVPFYGHDGFAWTTWGLHRFR